MSEILIAARIAAGSSHTFAVDVAPAAALPAGEYFRFALHYYARVLYELARDSENLNGLPDAIGRIAQSVIDRDSDLFEIAEVSGWIVPRVIHRVGDIDVAMRVSGFRDREISGDLTAFDNATLALSVIAVFQSILADLDESSLSAFPSALANMNASYELSHPYSDPESQREVPSVAYLASSFI